MPKHGWEIISTTLGTSSTQLAFFVEIKEHGDSRWTHGGKWSWRSGSVIFLQKSGTFQISFATRLRQSKLWMVQRPRGGCSWRVEKGGGCSWRVKGEERSREEGKREEGREGD